jgi:hypothetical protein
VEDEFSGDELVQALSETPAWIFRVACCKAFAGKYRPYLLDDDNYLWRLLGCRNLKRWQDNKDEVLTCLSQEVYDPAVHIRNASLKPGDPILVQKRVVADFDNMSARRQKKSEAGRKAGLASAQARSEKTETEEPMKLYDEIAIISIRTLGVKVEHKGYDVWKELDLLAKAQGETGRSDVVEAFRKWAEENAGEDFNGRPVQAFLKVATGILRGTIAVGGPSGNPELQELLRELVKISGGSVVFENKHASALGTLLKTFPKDEIVSAFRTYYGQVEGDAFDLKHAARRFTEVAPQLLELDRERKAEEELLQKQMRSTQERERAAADAEAEAIHKAKKAEEALIEEDPFG